MIITNIYLLININKKNKQLDSCVNTCNTAKAKEKKLKNYFIERDKRSISSEGLFITDSLRIKGINQTAYSLSELIEEPFSLIFYFEESHCRTCIEEELSRMNEYFGDSEKNNILILISGMNERNVKYLKKSNQINFGVYQIEPNKLKLPINKFGIPFLFVLSPNGKVHSLFIPELYEKEFSNNYYSHVKTLLFDSGLNASY